jgi:hypothetical protein
MHIDQQPYRNVYDLIQEYDGSELYGDIVRPWLRAEDGERRWLDAFARRGGEPVPEAGVEELWRLYALSRIVEILRLRLRSGEHAELMQLLGMQRIERPAFHPFFHEIVTVEQAVEERAGIEVVKESWPGYLLGPLLVCRAGVAVTAGAAHVDKTIAETSAMYWAFARRDRRTVDLSQGWGGNSQWRTFFRRDYLLDGVLHYNVDAQLFTHSPDDLTAEEQLELLRFRCFVKCTKPDEDRWPYGWSHQEEA